MQSGTATRLAWALWAVSLLLQTATGIVAYLARSYSLNSSDLPLVRLVLYLPVLFAFATIGALIAARQPRNPIGWLFLAMVLVSGVAGFAEGYWRYTLFVRPGALPGGELMLWINVRPYTVAWAVVFTLLVLLFPTGRPPSRRWWVVGWVIMLGGLINQTALAFLPGPLDPSVAISLLLNGILALAAALVAVAAGIAILRHHLFDIDLIIRRTLVYAILTGVLGLIYLLTIITLQALFVRLTGQGNTLAVVASTLAIAALFGPLRGWVQGQVDRRFDRTHYDARLVLEQFAARAQQEADLDALSADLLVTVDEALKPSEVRLWLVRRERRAP
jgi:hypothetical protein